MAEEFADTAIDSRSAAVNGAKLSAIMASTFPLMALAMCLPRRAANGFNVMPLFFPTGIEELVSKIVPELQRRGLFRREYEGDTLRANLGVAIQSV